MARRSRAGEVGSASACARWAGIRPSAAASERSGPTTSTTSNSGGTKPSASTIASRARPRPITAARSVPPRSVTYCTRPNAGSLARLPEIGEHVGATQQPLVHPAERTPARRSAMHTFACPTDVRTQDPTTAGFCAGPCSQNTCSSPLPLTAMLPRGTHAKPALERRGDRLGHLDLADLAERFHAAGGVHGVAPEVVNELPPADHPGDHRPAVEPDAHPRARARGAATKRANSSRIASAISAIAAA